MLIIGPTLIFMAACTAFVVLFRALTHQPHKVRVIREEQLYNRYEEEHNRQLPATKPSAVPAIPQREPIAREERVRTKNKTFIRDEEDRDPGIV